MKMVKKLKKTILMVLFMPSGGNHGGGRPTVPTPKITVSFSLRPDTEQAIADWAKQLSTNAKTVSKSAIAQMIFDEYFKKL